MCIGRSVCMCLCVCVCVFVVENSLKVSVYVLDVCVFVCSTKSCLECVMLLVCVCGYGVLRWCVYITLHLSVCLCVFVRARPALRIRY